MTKWTLNLRHKLQNARGQMCGEEEFPHPNAQSMFHCKHPKISYSWKYNALFMWATLSHVSLSMKICKWTTKLVIVPTRTHQYWYGFVSCSSVRFVHVQIPSEFWCSQNEKLFFQVFYCESIPYQSRHSACSPACLTRSMQHVLLVTGESTARCSRILIVLGT